jgi:hypothetical protein
LSHGVFYIFNANGTWRSEGPHMVISGTYAISSDYTLTFTVEGEDVSWIWEESDQRSRSGWYVTIDRLYLGNNTGHPRE